MNPTHEKLIADISKKREKNVSRGDCCDDLFNALKTGAIRFDSKHLPSERIMVNNRDYLSEHLDELKKSDVFIMVPSEEHGDVYITLMQLEKANEEHENELINQNIRQKANEMIKYFLNANCKNKK